MNELDFDFAAAFNQPALIPELIAQFKAPDQQLTILASGIEDFVHTWGEPSPHQKIQYFVETKIPGFWFYYIEEFQINDLRRFVQRLNALSTDPDREKVDPKKHYRSRCSLTLILSNRMPAIEPERYTGQMRLEIGAPLLTLIYIKENQHLEFQKRLEVDVGMNVYTGPSRNATAPSEVLDLILQITIEAHNLYKEDKSELGASNNSV